MKPYLIFVEGGNTPHRIFNDELSALNEAKRLAVKYPKKEVMLLQVAKRLISDNDSVVSLGSHFPEFTNLNTSNLVRSVVNKSATKAITVVTKKAKIKESPYCIPKIVLTLNDKKTHLESVGKQFHALCPFHKEKTPSFLVNSLITEYNCFGCGVNGKLTKEDYYDENAAIQNKA
jgi:hypothetical protein